MRASSGLNAEALGLFEPCAVFLTCLKGFTGLRNRFQISDFRLFALGVLFGGLATSPRLRGTNAPTRFLG